MLPVTGNEAIALTSAAKSPLIRQEPRCAIRGMHLGNSSFQFTIKVLLPQLLDTFDYRDCLGQVFPIANFRTMAPTSDDIHEVVLRLEARVKELEARLLKSEGLAPSTTKDGQSIRMILMGPPGAGKSWSFSVASLCFYSCLPLFVHLPNLGAIFDPCQWLIFSTGKGTQAPKIKERFACCHLVSFDLVLELTFELLIRM